MTRLDGSPSYDGCVQLQSASDLPVEEPPVRLPRKGRSWRLALSAAVLALLLAGTVWGEDDDFPFGPFKMYAGRAAPDGEVNSTRVVGLTPAGEEVRLSGGQVGLRRAEFEGQLPRLKQEPELLGVLAEVYADKHPSAPDLVSVQVVQRHFDLREGARTGAYQDTVLVEYRRKDQG
jgi:hypothetical protein